MRISTWFRLALLCLIAGGIQASCSQRRAATTRPQQRQSLSRRSSRATA